MPCPWPSSSATPAPKAVGRPWRAPSPTPACVSCTTRVAAPAPGPARRTGPPARRRPASRCRPRTASRARLLATGFGYDPEVRAPPGRGPAAGAAARPRHPTHRQRRPRPRPGRRGLGRRLRRDGPQRLGPGGRLARRRGGRWRRRRRGGGPGERARQGPHRGRRTRRSSRTCAPSSSPRVASPADPDPHPTRAYERRPTRPCRGGRLSSWGAGGIRPLIQAAIGAQDHGARDGEGEAQGRARQVLRRRHLAQAQAARAPEGGEEAHEAGRRASRCPQEAFLARAQARRRRQKRRQ